jgi:hypothetical protein
MPLVRRRVLDLSPCTISTRTPRPRRSYTQHQTYISISNDPYTAVQGNNLLPKRERGRNAIDSQILEVII